MVKSLSLIECANVNNGFYFAIGSELIRSYQNLSRGPLLARFVEPRARLLGVTSTSFLVREGK